MKMSYSIQYLLCQPLTAHLHEHVAVFVHIRRYFTDYLLEKALS